MLKAAGSDPQVIRRNKLPLLSKRRVDYAIKIRRRRDQMHDFDPRRLEKMGEFTSVFPLTRAGGETGQ